MTLSRILAALLSLTSLATFAQSPTDADFQPLVKERRWQEVEKLAEARLAADPADGTAVLYLASALIGDKARRAHAITRAEACVAKDAKVARCHHSLGRLYGMQAMDAGVLSMMSLAGKSRDGFAKAVELAPRDFDAVRDLNQYYLQAPGVVGGSVAKAIAAADAFAAHDATLGKVLRAEVHVYKKELAEAEALLAPLTTPPAGRARQALADATVSLAFQLAEAAQVPRALTLVKARLAGDMDNALLRFALGRAHLAANDFAAAIAEMERAMAMDTSLRGHYRLGMAYQGKGDKASALKAFEAFLAYAPAGKAKEDAVARVGVLRKG